MDRAMETFEQLSTPQSVAVVALPLAAGYILLSYVQRPRAYTPDGQPLPHPDGALPLLGSTLQLARNRHRMSEWITEVCEEKEGKPWMLKVLNRPAMVVVSAPEHIEDVYKTQSAIFVRSPLSLDRNYDLLGYGIVNSVGSHWKFQRKTASHLFSMQMMKDVMHTTIRERSREFVQVLSEHAKRGTVVPARISFTEFTTDVFTQIGFGVDLESMQKGLRGETNDFIESIRVMSRGTFRRFSQPHWLWTLRRMFGIGEEAEVAKSKQYLDGLVYDIIHKSIDKKKQEMEDGHVDDSSMSRPKDLITLFLDSQAKEASTTGKLDADPTLMRDMVFNFFFAGSATTSTTMAWILVELNRHPEVVSKIRAEIKSKFPHLLGGNAEVPTVEEIDQLHYLEGTIRETLRLNSTVPMSSRGALQSTTLVDGTYVSKGTEIMAAMRATGFLSSVWGEDAHEFKPERWIDQTTGDIIAFTPSQFPIFLTGPRQCIGQRMAMVELQIVICSMISKFDLKLLEDPHQIISTPGVELSVNSDLPIKVVPFHG